MFRMDGLLSVLLPLVVSALAWCRRRNVGILTWALRITPIVALPVNIAFGALFYYGSVFAMSLSILTLFGKSALLAMVALMALLAICGMIVWWPGFKLKSPVNRWPRMAFWSVYACCSVSISLGLMVAIPSAYLGAGMAYDCRTIDRSYATWEEMVRGSRSKRFAEWLPHTATNIHYLSHGKFGETTERLTCRCKEADLVRFAHEHAYPLATNAFTMLDYYIPEQGDVSWAYAQMAKDPETQRRLVFGDRPLPERFISLTCSRAFDGGASGGQWRVILVLDRDTDELTGYHWANWL